MFVGVFYVIRIGSIEKFVSFGWYFWKENFKLLEEGGGVVRREKDE